MPNRPPTYRPPRTRPDLKPSAQPAQGEHGDEQQVQQSQQAQQSTTTTKRGLDLRPSAARRGYDHRWQQLRLTVLADTDGTIYPHGGPLCRRCLAANPSRVTEATVVDHATPHRGDATLFNDPTNLVSLCKPCHDRKTATEDRHK